MGLNAKKRGLVPVVFGNQTHQEIFVFLACFRKNVFGNVIIVGTLFFFVCNCFCNYHLFIGGFQQGAVISI